MLPPCTKLLHRAAPGAERDPPTRASRGAKGLRSPTRVTVPGPCFQDTASPPALGNRLQGVWVSASAVASPEGPRELEAALEETIIRGGSDWMLGKNSLLKEL